MTVAERIKSIAHARGITAPALHRSMIREDCDVSISAVCRWIDGSRNPSAGYIPAVARSLGVSLGELYGEPARDAVRGDEEGTG